jgi:hypothetical protein
LSSVASREEFKSACLQAFRFDSDTPQKIPALSQDNNRCRASGKLWSFMPAGKHDYPVNLFLQHDVHWGKHCFSYPQKGHCHG